MAGRTRDLAGPLPGAFAPRIPGSIPAKDTHR